MDRILQRKPERQNGKEALEENGYTPTIVLAELSRKYFREGFTADEVRKRL